MSIKQNLGLVFSSLVRIVLTGAPVEQPAEQVGNDLVAELYG